MTAYAPERSAAGEVFGDPFACRRLWSAVLAEQFRILFAPKSSETALYAEQVRSWLGTPDFRLVCDLAGLDAELVEAEFHCRLSEGSKLRRGTKRSYWERDFRNV